MAKYSKIKSDRLFKSCKLVKNIIYSTSVPVYLLHICKPTISKTFLTSTKKHKLTINIIHHYTKTLTFTRRFFFFENRLRGFRKLTRPIIFDILTRWLLSCIQLAHIFLSPCSARYFVDPIRFFLPIQCKICECLI